MFSCKVGDELTRINFPLIFFFSFSFTCQISVHASYELNKQLRYWTAVKDTNRHKIYEKLWDLVLHKTLDLREEENLSNHVLSVEEGNSNVIRINQYVINVS